VTLPTVQQFLAACRADLGKQEYPRGSNHQEFAARAHHANDEPWCLTYLIAEALKTGLRLPYYGAYTPSLAQAFKAQGRYGTTPRVGAFGFVYHPKIGRIAHVFAVEQVLADRYTIGFNGNSNTDGSREGYMVCRVKRSPLNITYGYPVYALTAPVTHPNPYPVPVLGSREYIARGTRKTKAETQYIQWAAGGPAYDDGVWGDKTDDLVGDFQDRHGLRRDYRVGPKTLADLKAVRR
jgi:hypothetical protein